MPDRRVAGIFGALLTMIAGGSAAAPNRAGVPPDGPWACPESHPIKGYLSRESDRRIYFVPGNRFYEEASPERCYASESEAQRDGSRPARESPPLRSSDGLI